MLHAILAFVLLCAAAFAQKAPIIFQNLATARQSAWLFVGLPAGHVPQSKAGWLKSESEKFPYVTEAHGLRVFASVPAGSCGDERERPPWPCAP